MSPAIIFCAFFLLIGATAIAWGLRYLGRARAARSWSLTDGRIMQSRVESYVDQSDSDSTLMYQAVVEYRYTVSGSNYEGNRVRFGGGGASSVEESAAKVVREFHRGLTVPVYYDPQNPAKSVLDRKPSLWIYAPIIVGLIIVLLAGGLLLAAWEGSLIPESEKRGEDRTLSMECVRERPSGGADPVPG